MAVKASASIQLIRVNDGQNGSGVTSATYEYYLSTSKTQMVGSSWSPNPPVWEKGKYLWKRMKIVYKNPPKTEYTTPIVDSSWEMANDVENSISSLITDENGTSLMQQTSNGWQFNISAIQNDLSNAANKINKLSGSIDGVNDIVNKINSTIEDLGEKTAYINVTMDDSGSPCLELGKAGDPFRVRITNKSMDFMHDSFKIAYISNQTLYIERALIKNELQIGEENTGFIWKQRANGNLGLRRIR